MIGIEFEISGEYKNLFKMFFDGVNIEKYKFELTQLDAFYLDDKKNAVSLDNTFEELVESKRNYSVIFGNLKVFRKSSKIKKIDTFKDFIDSKCELVMLIVDVYEIEIYFKNNELKLKILKNLDNLGIKYKIKTVENDGRTRMYI